MSVYIFKILKCLKHFYFFSILTCWVNTLILMMNSHVSSVFNYFLYPNCFLSKYFCSSINIYPLLWVVLPALMSSVCPLLCREWSSCCLLKLVRALMKKSWWKRAKIKVSLLVIVFIMVHVYRVALHCNDFHIYLTRIKSQFDSGRRQKSRAPSHYLSKNIRHKNNAKLFFFDKLSGNLCIPDNHKEPFQCLTDKEFHR